MLNLRNRSWLKHQRIYSIVRQMSSKFGKKIQNKNYEIQRG